VGVRALVVFYITSLIGAGILLVPGLAARTAGPASLVAWGVLAAASYPFAHLFAQMSARLPDAAGLSAFVRLTIGGRPADACAIALVAVYVIGNPVMGLASARYLLHFMGWPVDLLYPTACAFMLLSVAINLLSLAAGARLQAFALVALLAGLGVAIVLAVPHMSAARLAPFAPHGWPSVGAAVLVAFFSFLGWENVSTLAEEVRDPQRSYRRAIALAVPAVGLLYLAVAAAFLAVPRSHDEIVVLTALLRAPLGQAGALAGDVLALAIIVVATNAWVLGASRLTTAAARDGLLPMGLALRAPRSGAPVRALVALGCCYVGILSTLGALHLDESTVVSVTSAVFLLLYIVTALAALRTNPSATLRLSALATLGASVLFLALAGWALIAGLVVLAGCSAAAYLLRQRSRRSGTVSVARHSSMNLKARAMPELNPAGEEGL
jgi:amino acid efflux transporter